MKISENGALILSGSGLKTVRQRIEKRFAEARQCGPTQVCNRAAARELRSTTDLPMPVATKPQPSLQQKAEILAKTVPTSGSITYHRRNIAECWDIGAVPVVDNVNELFDEALRALGYPSVKPSMDLLRTCLSVEPEKESIWKRSIFRRTR